MIQKVQKRFKKDYIDGLSIKVYPIDGFPDIYQFEVDTKTNKVYNKGILVGSAQFLNDVHFTVKLFTNEN